MEFNIVIKKRHSIRAFTKKKASWKSILDAIDAALKNPFAGNINHLKFVIVEEKETIKKIADLAEQTWISNAGILIVVCSDDTHLERLYGARGRVYSRQQAGAAIQTILLKLVDLGLSACWVGSYEDTMIKHLLSIPKNIQIEAVIPIGYEDTKAQNPKTRKRELEKVLRWENWKTENRPYLFQEPQDPKSLK